MGQYPTTFATEHVSLRWFDLSERGVEALDNLESRGLEMVTGIMVADVDDILAIAETNAVREFCPNDAKRFTQADKWFQKATGRGAFLLRNIDNHDLIGYSWVGEEEEPTPELPDSPTTTAFRSTMRGTGKDQVIGTVEGARAIYGSIGLGLETWASNKDAVKCYVNPRVGARLVAPRTHELNKATGEMERIFRPTISETDFDRVVDGKRQVRDTRLFMAFPEPEAA